MKRFKNILVFIFLSQIVSAQNIPKNDTYEVGLNINLLLDQSVFKSTDNENILGLSTPSIYKKAITYRHYYGEKFAFRMGLGFFRKTLNDTTFSVFSTTIQENSIRYIGGNIGYQKQIKLGRKMQFYIGLEANYHHQKNIEKINRDFSGGFPGTQNSEIIKTDNQFGVGIPLGFQFYLSERILISTEGSVQGYHIFKREEDISFNFTNDLYKTSLTGFDFIIPKLLFLNFQF